MAQQGATKSGPGFHLDLVDLPVRQQGHQRFEIDPAFTPAGEVTDYDDASWETAEVKFQTDDLGGNPNLTLVTGARHESYGLDVTVYDSADFASGAKTTLGN